MLPLVSNDIDYFCELLAGEKFRKLPFSRITCSQVNEVDLSSNIRDVAGILPIECICLEPSEPYSLVEIYPKCCEDILQTKYISFGFPTCTINGWHEVDDVNESQFFPTWPKQKAPFGSIHIYREVDTIELPSSFARCVPEQLLAIEDTKFFPAFNVLLPFLDTLLPQFLPTRKNEFPSQQLNLFLPYGFYENTSRSNRFVGKSDIILFSNIFEPINGALRYDALRSFLCEARLNVTSRKILQLYCPTPINSNNKCAGSKKASGMRNIYRRIQFSSSLNEMSSHMGWLRAVDVATEFTPSEPYMSIHIDIDFGVLSFRDDVAEGKEKLGRKRAAFYFQTMFNSLPALTSIETIPRLCPFLSIPSVPSTFKKKTFSYRASSPLFTASSSHCPTLLEGLHSTPVVNRFPYAVTSMCDPLPIHRRSLVQINASVTVLSNLLLSGRKILGMCSRCPGCKLRKCSSCLADLDSYQVFCRLSHVQAHGGVLSPSKQRSESSDNSFLSRRSSTQVTHYTAHEIPENASISQDDTFISKLESSQSSCEQEEIEDHHRTDVKNEASRVDGDFIVSGANVHIESLHEVPLGNMICSKDVENEHVACEMHECLETYCSPVLHTDEPSSFDDMFEFFLMDWLAKSYFVLSREDANDGSGNEHCMKRLPPNLHRFQDNPGSSYNQCTRSNSIQKNDSKNFNHFGLMADKLSNKSEESRNKSQSLSGLLILMSEELFVYQPLCAAVMKQKYNIMTIERPLEPSLDCIIDEVTGVSVIPEQFILNAEACAVKSYIKQLTKLALKFDFFWILILQYDSADDQTGHVNSTKLHSSYCSFYQSFSQFSTVQCYIHIRIVTQATTLPSQLFTICQEAAKIAATKDNVLLSTFLARPFLSESADKFQMHCELLQLFPSINYFVAAFLLHHISIKNLFSSCDLYEDLLRLQAMNEMSSTLCRCKKSISLFKSLVNSKFFVAPSI